MGPWRAGAGEREGSFHRLGRLPLTCCADVGSGLRRVTHVVHSFSVRLPRARCAAFAPWECSARSPLPLSFPRSPPATPAPSYSPGYASPVSNLLLFSVALALRWSPPSSSANLICLPRPRLFGGAPGVRQLPPVWLGGRNRHETDGNKAASFRHK